MIIHTEQEIKDKVYELLDPATSCFREAEVTVKQNNTYISIKIGAMYSAPKPAGGIVGFFMELSEFFGTKKIDMGSFEHSGCETCDYGSEYGFELIIRPE